MLHKPGKAVLSRELSERIAMLRFPLIVGVVFLHAYDPAIGPSIRLQYTGWLKFLFDYVSEGLATVSVPLYFLLAGYLFFFGFQSTPDQFRRKLINRARTLLVPLVFWNVLCLGLLALAQSDRDLESFFSGRSEPISRFSALDYVNAIFGVTAHPIAFQFWFIRDLIVLALLSPLIYVLVKKVPLIFLSLLAIRWFSGSTAWTVPFLSREAMFFFCMGSFLALNQMNPLMLDQAWRLTLIYVPWSILDALTKSEVFNNPIHKTAELLGVAFAFCCTRWVRHSPSWTRGLIGLSSASFFVFAAHEPLLTVVRKLSYHFLRPSGNLGIAFLYFADPIAVTVVCLSTYFICAWRSPAFTRIITGGRMAQPEPLLPPFTGAPSAAQLPQN